MCIYLIDYELHCLLETALGVANVEEIANASPRIQGMSLGPADLAASRRMKTTRIGGGHPGYLVRDDPDPENPQAARGTHQQDLWHYTLGRMVDACVSVGALPFTALSVLLTIHWPVRTSSATPFSWDALALGLCTPTR